jgi:hypothetical protein
VTRRAKLYYLRERVGKAVRLKERRVDAQKRDRHAAKAKEKLAAQLQRAQQKE